MTDDQIKRMAARFLMWKLPLEFSPDCGISFKPEFNENTPLPMRHEPTGTNLLNAEQAEAMIRFLVEGLDDPDAGGGENVAIFSPKGGVGEGVSLPPDKVLKAALGVLDDVVVIGEDKEGALYVASSEGAPITIAMIALAHRHMLNETAAVRGWK